MDEIAFFDGKLRKRSLPVFHGPPPANAHGPKRLLLSQGELANFYDEDQGIRYLATLELRLGSIRGNHVHRSKLEHVYIVSGCLLLAAAEEKNADPVTMELGRGDLVTIKPGIAHAFKTLEAGYAVEFSPQVFDPADLEKILILE